MPPGKPATDDELDEADGGGVTGQAHGDLPVACG